MYTAFDANELLKSLSESGISGSLSSKTVLLLVPTIDVLSPKEEGAPTEVLKFRVANTPVGKFDRHCVRLGPHKFRAGSATLGLVTAMRNKSWLTLVLPEAEMALESEKLRVPLCLDQVAFTVD